MGERKKVQGGKKGRGVPDSIVTIAVLSQKLGRTSCGTALGVKAESSTSYGPGAKMLLLLSKRATLLVLGTRNLFSMEFKAFRGDNRKEGPMIWSNLKSLPLQAFFCYCF